MVDIGNLRAFVRMADWKERTCQLLTVMAMGGQSVTLNWGEDDGLWECSWITGDERFTAFAKRYDEAIVQVVRQVIDRAEGR